MHFDVIVAGRYSRSVGIGMVASGILDAIGYQLRAVHYDPRPELSDYTGFPQHLSRFSGSTFPHTASVCIYTDVLWNGKSDHSLSTVPNTPLKFAFTMFDSSIVPREWVEICNSELDAVIVPDAEVKKAYERSGVWKPVFVLSLPLDLRSFRSVPLRAPGLPFTFGCVAAYHKRKNIVLLIQSFLECFGPMNTSVRLRIHSNLDFNGEYQRAADLVQASGAQNITLTHSNLNNLEYVELLKSFDVFVQLSKGEGYSIAPRQALALGKSCILSDAMAQRALCESGLVIRVAGDLLEPAVYDEIDGLLSGVQYNCTQSDVVDALLSAYENRMEQQAKQRRRFAEQFSVEALAEHFRTLFIPSELFVGETNEIRSNCLVTGDRHLIEKYRRARPSPYRVRSKREVNQVIMGHDAGFFSLFNTFTSHLVWNVGRPGVRYVLPDWRVTKMKEFWGDAKFTSFCYARRQDGNLWIRLFESLYDDLGDACYEDDDFLYLNNTPIHNFNQHNEPLLTFIHAYKLYRTPDFAQWRHRYNSFYKKYIRPRPLIQRKVDEVYFGSMEGIYCVGVHARHPSHAMEQPDGTMPYLDRFVQLAQSLIETRPNRSFDVRVFLATDQDTVVEYFRRTFGDKLIAIGDISRTTIQQDEKFHAMGPEERNREGHQIQHLMAADEQNWSVHLAEEVVVDSLLLARCQALVHTTSNIATAVSFMNPEIQMVYCE